MERRAEAAERLAAQSAGRDALDNAVRAAELYMRAAEETSNKAEAAILRRKCQRLIVYAESLKEGISPAVEQRQTSAETEILRTSSCLHGNEFPPWKNDPADGEFVAATDGQLFTDDTRFTLSSTQRDNFKAWLRPNELFNDQLHESSQFTDMIMEVSDQSNLVQDITTDCSVVASLSAAFRILTGKHAVLSSIFHPFDHVRRRPKHSASGKYVMRLNFNGCPRRVVIDDRLPGSRTERALFVMDRYNSSLLWPALLEKAYLKVRGGYDFPGSNSGTDLWVITGWIPEQLFLQREDFDINDIWDRIKAAHKSQDVVITLGTGRVSSEEEQMMGLIGEHDYAVEDIETTSGNRNLLIKNPWCDGPPMSRTGWTTPPYSQARSVDPACPTPSTSTLWVAFEDVTQHFESMYLNWNPALFANRIDRHFNWVLSPNKYSTSLLKNPQYSLSSTAGGTAWVLVSRHFADAELDIARSRRDSMAAVARQLGFMSIIVFKNKGKRIQVSGGEMYRGPYVDSPQTLARLDTKPGEQYTIVVDQHELPLPHYAFTMSIFSHKPVTLHEATETMSNIQEKTGAWTRRTAGGNASCSTYFQNPQYSISLQKASPVSVLLSADAEDLHVHVDLVWGRGDRVMSLKGKDLIASSGEYRRGCAVADVAMLEPGTYTLVCSTFDPGQVASYAIRVASMTLASLQTVPADGAGRLVTQLPRLRLREGHERRRVSVGVTRLTRANISFRSVAGAQPGARRQPPSSLMLRVSAVYGAGPEKDVKAVSGGGEFQDPASTIRLTDFDIEPARAREGGGFWIVVESVGSHDITWDVDGEIYSDCPVQIGAWETSW